MKRLMLIFTSLFSTIVLTTSVVAAVSFWQLSISSPATQTSHTFNVQYTVLSTNADTFTVQLLQDGAAVPGATQDTGSDPHATNGNSGSFSVTVSADDTYQYQVIATRDGSSDTKTTNAVNVKVDTQAPAAPSYGGKTRSGNTYTLSFTAPSSPDVTRVQIFTSTSTTYQAGDATRVGDVHVTPGQSTTFTYTAPDSATRYFALEAFDAAGNGSPTVGDPGVVVNPIRVIASSSTAGTGANIGTTTAATVTSGATNPTGSILGATTTTTNGGTVTAPGNSTTSKSHKTTTGKVLGATNTVKHSNQNWLIGGILIVAVALLYYLGFRRPGHLFGPKV